MFKKGPGGSAKPIPARRARPRRPPARGFWSKFLTKTPSRARRESVAARGFFGQKFLAKNPDWRRPILAKNRGFLVKNLAKKAVASRGFWLKSAEGGFLGFLALMWCLFFKKTPHRRGFWKTP